jgi:hypothetical protein
MNRLQVLFARLKHQFLDWDWTLHNLDGRGQVIHAEPIEGVRISISEEEGEIVPGLEFDSAATGEDKEKWTQILHSEIIPAIFGVQVVDKNTIH